MDGFNVCIFAYGQTGTGKTFTMEGFPENRGVNYRALEELFRMSEERSSSVVYTFSVSILEVYNEKIRDLLDDSCEQTAKRLDMKQSADGTQEVPGLVEAPIYTIDGVWEKLKAGARNRSVGSTSANELSSRSHRQYAQRSRVRKLQYIAELERKVQTLQSEGIEVSAEMEFLTQQNIMLGMENKTLKQRLESLTQEQLIKRYYGGKAQYVRWGKEAGLDLTSDDDFFSDPTIKSYYKAFVENFCSSTQMLIPGMLEQTSSGTIKPWELIWLQCIFILTLGCLTQ